MEDGENRGEYKGVVVNGGIEEGWWVNGYLKGKGKKGEVWVGEYVEGIVKGDVRILRGGVRVVESVKREDEGIGEEVIEKWVGYWGNWVGVGMRGVGGGGKSRCMDVLGLDVLEK